MGFLKLPFPHERFRAGWAAAAAHGTEKSAAGHRGHSRPWGDPMIPELGPEMVGKWLENGWKMVLCKVMLMTFSIIPTFETRS